MCRRDGGRGVSYANRHGRALFLHRSHSEEITESDLSQKVRYSRNTEGGIWPLEILSLYIKSSQLPSESICLKIVRGTFKIKI